jgi:predicted metal-dependent peptidase
MLKKAKMNLILNHPFFAQIALRMEYIEDEKVGTMSISRKAIRYSPTFVKSLRLEECVGVLAHEVLHYSLGHHARGKGKEQDRWNKACDYVINPILMENKLKLPSNCLYDPRFNGLNAEQVYQILEKEEGKEEKQPQQDEKGSGKSDDNAPQNWGKVEEPEDGEEQVTEAEAKETTIQAMNAAKQAGKGINGAFEKAIKELLEPKKNWWELLQKYFAERAKNDYTWTRPNYKYLQMGLYLPSLHSLELGRIVFVIDTSGSMNTGLLAKVIAELKEAMKLFNLPVTVIHCDSEVRKVEELEQDSAIVPIGGGGTRFQPTFDYVTENLPDTKALVYFTDGFCRQKPTEPEYDTIWIVYDNPTFKMEFGNVIFI